MDEAEWQRLELGDFSDDIATWISIARGFSGPVLELGAGAGRVTFPLIEAGCSVIALEPRQGLARYLDSHARSRDISLRVERSPMESVEQFEPSPGLVIAPMQVVQYLAPGDLWRALARLCRLWDPPPSVAISFLQDDLVMEGVSIPDEVPVMRERDQWVYASRIVRVECDQSRVVLERIRETVDPQGQVSVDRTTESLWRLSEADLIQRMELNGYRLEQRHSLPGEYGSIPALLLVFSPQEALVSR